MLRARRGLSLRARWAMAIAFYGLLLLGVVLLVRHFAGESSQAPLGGSRAEEAAAQQEADVVGRIAIRQDEQPRTARLVGGVPAGIALEAAISVDVRSRISHGQLTGPLQRVSCSESGAARGARHPFRCAATADGISYPFVGVADPATGELVWCKEDGPPEGDRALAVPVSARCRA